MEAVNGDEGRGFGRNDPGVEVGKLVRLQVAAEDLKAGCVKVAPDSSPNIFRRHLLYDELSADELVRQFVK